MDQTKKIGFGGSIGFGDSNLNFGLSYVTNTLDPVSSSDQRTEKLVEATYKSLKNGVTPSQIESISITTPSTHFKSETIKNLFNLC